MRSSCPEVQSAKAMSGADPNAFSLDIDTVQLTRALKHLRKFASQGEVVCLKYDAGTLTVSMGRTSRDVPATGTWPWPLCVVRPWADALATNPFEPSITVLRHADGKLWARGFGVECSLEPCEEEGEEVVKREENIDLACQILASYKVTKLEVIALIDESDSAKARLWGPNDGHLIDDVAVAWLQLAGHGVEPSDIRRLFDRKSRELWKSGHKRDAEGYTPFARYHVTEREKMDLIESGDLAKARLWGPNDRLIMRDIADAWKGLFTYGVEPSDIRRLINRKSG